MNDREVARPEDHSSVVGERCHAMYLSSGLQSNPVTAAFWPLTRSVLETRLVKVDVSKIRIRSPMAAATRVPFPL